MIKTIIFDFGDVLVRDTTKFLEKKYPCKSMTAQQKRVYRLANDACEIGKIPASRLFGIFHLTIAPSLAPKEVERFMLSHAKVLPPWHLAEELSKNYKVLILSNNFRRWPEKMAKALKIDIKKFPFINSACVGLRKPQKEIYGYMMKKFNLKPQECIYIDDRRANLAPAKALGFQTFLYGHNYGSLLRFLKSKNVKFR